MPKALINGINIHYQIRGQGPNLVLIHGATGNMAFWYLSSLAALEKKFRVILYDLRGHGYSDCPPTGYSSGQMAADLRGLLDYLEIERTHLIGHSFGGVTALHTTVLFPERVESLVLADPEIPVLRSLCSMEQWPFWDSWKEQLRELGIDMPDEKWDDMDYMLRQCIYIPMAHGLRKGKKRLGKRILRLLDDTTAVRDFREIDGLTQERIMQVRQPTLAMYGELSPFLPVCSFLSENMPNCKSIIVPTGHLHPGLEPEIFYDTVSRFLFDPEHFKSEEQKEHITAFNATSRSAIESVLNRPNVHI